jgi:hypothetical protein
MRTHGVPSFPDPDPSGGFSILLTPGGETRVNGVSVGGPAYQSAAEACRFGGSGRNPAVPERERLALLAFARCMRHHGFPRWADPTFPAGGGVMGGGGYGIDAPGVKQAATICNQAAHLTTGG